MTIVLLVSPQNGQLLKAHNVLMSYKVKSYIQEVYGALNTNNCVSDLRNTVHNRVCDTEAFHAF